MSAPTFDKLTSSNTDIVISWTALTTSAQKGGSGVSITFYELYYFDSSLATPAWVLETSTAGLTATKSSLTGGQTYRFKVRAMNKLGT
jgi:hypothetical protein